MKERFELKITGMHCAACSSRIERVVGKMAEVDAVAVSLPANRATVTLVEGTERQAGVNAVIERIKKINFGSVKFGKTGICVLSKKILRRG